MEIWFPSDYSRAKKVLINFYFRSNNSSFSFFDPSHTPFEIQYSTVFGQVFSREDGRKKKNSFKYNKSRTVTFPGQKLKKKIFFFFDEKKKRSNSVKRSRKDERRWKFLSLFPFNLPETIFFFFQKISFVYSIFLEQINKTYEFSWNLYKSNDYIYINIYICLACVCVCACVIHLWY